MIGTAIAALITAVATLVAAGIAAYSKLHDALVPLLRRRRFKIAIVVRREHDKDVRRFATLLRDTGYRSVDLTRDPVTVLGRAVVVLWQPGQDAQMWSDRARTVAPDATVIAYSHQRVQLRLNEQTLAANSLLRVRGDLATLAEVRK